MGHDNFRTNKIKKKKLILKQAKQYFMNNPSGPGF